jgi:hypothetical protein
VSKTASDEPITCASCEYRYPPSERICPMCGTEPLQPLLAVPNKFSPARHEVRPSSSDGQQGTLGPRLRRFIPVVVVLIALMAVTSFFYKSRKDQLAKESGAATEPTATSEQIKLENTGGRPIVHNQVGGVQHVVAGKLGTALTATSEQIKLENAGERQVVHNPVRGVQHLVTAKLGTAQTTNAAKEADPVELWKAVKRGSVSAEVALANLYLEGEAVPQNCEQAHMLLHAASMKGNKSADDLLKSSYTVRCE